MATKKGPGRKPGKTKVAKKSHGLDFSQVMPPVPLPKTVKEVLRTQHILPPLGQPDFREIRITDPEPCTLGIEPINWQLEAYAAGMDEVGRRMLNCHVADNVEDAKATLRSGAGVGIDVTAYKSQGLSFDMLDAEYAGPVPDPGPLTMEKITEAMALLGRTVTGRKVRTERPLWDRVQPIMDNTSPGVEPTYQWFKDRYTKFKWTDTPVYGGKMSDYMNQNRYWFQPSSYTPNHIDDIYDRAWRRLQMKGEAKVREYCRDEVRNEGYMEWRLIFFRITGAYLAPPSMRLTGPYGWNGVSGTGILIQYHAGSDDHPWPERQEADLIAGIFIGWGCAPRFAAKAADCLYGCAQYSCIVTVSKLALANLGRALEVVGVTLTITQHPGEYLPDADKDIR